MKILYSTVCSLDDYKVSTIGLFRNCGRAFLIDIPSLSMALLVVPMGAIYVGNALDFIKNKIYGKTHLTDPAFKL